jgi:3-oxoadipate enol-lactonase
VLSHFPNHVAHESIMNRITNMENNRKEKIFKSGYGDIYYNLSGPSNAPAIVFVHGVGMDHKTFDGQAKAIGSKYRLLMWDLPGHGKSTFEQDGQHFTTMAADCMYALMMHAGVEKAVLVGQSLGSMIIQHFISKYPDKVLATVHVPGIDLTDPFNPPFKILIDLMLGMVHLIPEKTFYDSFGRHRAENPGVQKYLSNAIGRAGKKLVMRITKDMVDDLFKALPNPEIRPMLIAYGEKDLSFIRKGSLKWHRKAGYSKCVVIPKANHIANQDNAEDFNQAFANFLNESGIR